MIGFPINRDALARSTTENDTNRKIYIRNLCCVPLIEIETRGMDER